MISLSLIAAYLVLRESLNSNSEKSNRNPRIWDSIVLLFAAISEFLFPFIASEIAPLTNPQNTVLLRIPGFIYLVLAFVSIALVRPEVESQHPPIWRKPIVLLMVTLMFLVVVAVLVIALTLQ